MITVDRDRYLIIQEWRIPNVLRVFRLGLHKRKLLRIRDESKMFLYRIGFAVYTQEDESQVKTSRFGHVSGDFESGF